ncbi:glucose 1-dehydrogenase [Actinoplanes sp. NPDC023936]|uniref:SDR family NAD(P)-dependent oxidoreductase n=1 Tax=Actinoplanes sp. NPDC023936 TaxID=3154910 RepID=UPI0033E83025
MGRFDGKTVIITGAARGLGASHARGFAAEGANVVLTDVLEDEGYTVAKEIGDQAVFMPLDVTDAAAWETVVRDTETKFGPVSVLVNNAGVASLGGLEQTDPATWRWVLDVNVTGAFLGIRAVAPSLRKAGGGSIVNVSSVAGMMGVPGLGGYTTTKWALRGLTKVAALELARDGVRVNSVHPGAVHTSMTVSPETGEVLFTDLEALAVDRLAQPSEITSLVLFIASEEAAFSTGSEFIADGGRLLGYVPQAATAD